MSAGHDVNVRYSHRFHEYVPECVCGWAGSYWLSHHEADREAENHIRVEATR